MEITIYGTPTCGSCKSFKKKLEDSNIEFFYIDDERTIDYAQMKGISSVPIIEIDGFVYNKEQAEKIIFKG